MEHPYFIRLKFDDAETPFFVSETGGLTSDFSKALRFADPATARLQRRLLSGNFDCRLQLDKLGVA